MKLHERLSELRKKNKLTQQRVADYLGISRGAYANYETGAREPDTDTLIKLADLFGVTVDSLVGRTDDPTPPRQTSNIPSWATPKDVRDFKKMLEEDAPVMFDGVPLDEEDREKVMRVMEAIFWDAKKRNKRKPVEE